MLNNRAMKQGYVQGAYVGQSRTDRSLGTLLLLCYVAGSGVVQAAGNLAYPFFLSRVDCRRRR